MPATVMAASLEHIQKTFDVRIDVSVRILQRIANAGLGCEMNDGRKVVPGTQRLRRLAIGQVGFRKGEISLALEDIQARQLQRGVVVVVDAVEAGNPAAGGQ